MYSCSYAELLLPRWVDSEQSGLWAAPINPNTLILSADNCLYSKNMSKPARDIRIITQQEQAILLSPPLKQTIRAGPSQGDSEDERLRTIPPGSSKVVEFEEFVPEDDKQRVPQNTITASRFEKQPRTFLIAVPSNPARQQQQSAQELTPNIQQPPAPKNKNVQKQRAFVFPFLEEPVTSSKDVPNAAEQNAAKAAKKTKVQRHSEPINNWQIEREELYRQRSRLQTQILVKDGQLQILQKILSSLVGTQIQPEELISKIANSYFQRLLEEKENQINLLLAKITDLNQELTRRAEDLANAKDQSTRLAFANQHLNNQLYVAHNIKKNSDTYFDTYHSQKESAPCDYLKKLTRRDTKQNAFNTRQDQKNQSLQIIYHRLERLSYSRKQLEEREHSIPFNGTFLKEGNWRSVKEGRLTAQSLKRAFC